MGCDDDDVSRQMMETDWLPARVELAAPGAGSADMHPVSFRSRERTHLTRTGALI